MRYPRLSANAKLVIGTMPSHVVCTGTGWDNLTDTRRRKRSNPVKSAATRVRESANTEPSINLLDKVAIKRSEWIATAPGPVKKKLMSQLRQLEMRAGIRDKSGKPVELDNVGETWATKKD